MRKDTEGKFHEPSLHLELETAVISDRGKRSAMYKQREPQPQPSSNTVCPSLIWARSQHSSAATMQGWSILDSQVRDHPVR